MSLRRLCKYKYQLICTQEYQLHGANIVEIADQQQHPLLRHHMTRTGHVHVALKLRSVIW